jgi:small-conductance mechanosensitive channel
MRFCSSLNLGIIRKQETAKTFKPNTKRIFGKKNPLKAFLNTNGIMFSLPIAEIPVPDTVLNGLGEGATGAAENVGTAALQLVGNPAILIGGILLVVGAIIIFFLLKKIIINSILGIAAWVLLTYVFHVELPLIPSLAISVIFGLAGIGAMLVLRFFGLF